jgi:hypothetical protein
MPVELTTKYFRIFLMLASLRFGGSLSLYDCDSHFLYSFIYIYIFLYFDVLFIFYLFFDLLISLLFILSSQNNL